MTDLSQAITEYERLTDLNLHTEAVRVLVAFAVKGEERKRMLRVLQAIEERHARQGYLSDADDDVRYIIERAAMRFAKAKGFRLPALGLPNLPRCPHCDMTGPCMWDACKHPLKSEVRA